MSKRLQQQRTQQIQDKNTLMNSMNNLINHITISKKNQEEMFGNLTRKDFDKIVANFQDQLLKLRLTTVQLLTQLLYLNSNLKKKFCSLMNIYFCQDSNIVLNNNLSKILQKFPNRSPQIFILLKSYSKLAQWPIPIQLTRQGQPLFWYINPKKETLTIQYLYREDIVNLIKFTNVNSSNSSSNLEFDPIDCIFGVNLFSKQQKSNTDLRIVTTQSINTQNRSRNNSKYNQPIRKDIIHDSFTPKAVVFHQNFVPMSARNGDSVHPNSSFLKQNNRQQPQLFVREIPQAKKNNYVQMTSKTMIDERTPQSSIQTQYPNSSTSFQVQSYSNTVSKKQNQGRLSLGDRDKYKNRLSLQMYQLRGGQKKNITMQGSNLLKPQITKKQPSHFQQHHHGIQLITPRQSWKNNSNQQKLSIVNNGSATDRQHTEKPASSRQNQQKNMNDSNQSLGNTQKLKTIHLGRGTKGWETARQKKNIKLQSH